MECAVELREAVKVFWEARQPHNNGRIMPRQRLLRGLGLDREPVTAVDRVSLSVSRGEIFGILGPNGSGKSTLIRLIATLLLPDGGDILVFGHNAVKDRMAVRRLINRVSVDAAFFKKLSARENLTYAGRLYGMGAEQIGRRMNYVFDMLRFPRRKADVSLADLSRGQQQKVAVARALLTSPVLVLLDEPTTGLDPVSKRDVQDFVLEVNRSHDATIILTSHDMAEVERMAGRTAVIDQGRIVALDSPQALVAEHCQGKDNGSKTPTLEDVFFALTGRDVEEAEA